MVKRMFSIDQLQNLLQHVSFTDQIPPDIWSVYFGYLVGSFLPALTHNNVWCSSSATFSDHRSINNGCMMGDTMPPSQKKQRTLKVFKSPLQIGCICQSQSLGRQVTPKKHLHLKVQENTIIKVASWREAFWKDSWIFFTP